MHMLEISENIKTFLTKFHCFGIYGSFVRSNRRVGAISEARREIIMTVRCIVRHLELTHQTRSTLMNPRHVLRFLCVRPAIKRLMGSDMIMTYGGEQGN